MISKQDDADMPRLRGDHQRRLAARRVARLDVGAALDQILGQRRVAVARRRDQQRLELTRRRGRRSKQDEQHSQARYP